MLRIYCLQQWYQLSDPGAEEALYDIHSMRAFCGLELGHDALPDETTILNFRHLLERHDFPPADWRGAGGFRPRKEWLWCRNRLRWVQIFKMFRTCPQARRDACGWYRVSECGGFPFLC